MFVLIDSVHNVSPQIRSSDANKIHITVSGWVKQEGMTYKKFKTSFKLKITRLDLIDLKVDL